MAYSTEVPDDYNRKFVLPYDKNNNIDDKLINATDEIMNIQKKFRLIIMPQLEILLLSWQDQDMQKNWIIL